MVIENISMQDDYEGNFSTRRSLLYTIRFTAKTYLFGPVGDTSKASKDLIKKFVLVTFKTILLHPQEILHTR